MIKLLNDLEQGSFPSFLTNVVNKDPSDAIPASEEDNRYWYRVDNSTPIKYGPSSSTDVTFPAGTHVRMPAVVRLSSPRTTNKDRSTRLYATHPSKASIHHIPIIDTNSAPAPMTFAASPFEYSGVTVEHSLKSTQSSHPFSKIDARVAMAALSVVTCLFI